ncbi:baculoviral IAP repeat-containing protein 7-A-like [Mya arenaria]|uniref:baculoviral IAP repeat-containing protein 7-A-like n=1 Tax=Mya arenaria TaxID=6604 RepID=UPI0022E7D7EC|nr:baculoviral IAP repeat-containing protein 7-A-like [Mya arenaria]
MDNISDRMNTFDNWQYTTSPSKLAEAGFFSIANSLYYNRYHDIVKCYSCGTSLRYLTEDDDPWAVHEQVSNLCPFLTSKAESSSVARTSPRYVEKAPSEMSMSELEEYNRRRRTMLECRVCRERQACMLLIPCGRRATCGEYARNTSTCPDCEGDVTKMVKTYIA